jgi:DNA-binding winged helix-turn-helix (wHTH) protein
LRVRFGEFELDEGNALLLRGGSTIPLSPTPFGLLCALAKQPGSLLTKHALLDEVWGHRFVSDSVLKGTISDIRTVLGDDPRSPRFIETVARRGYRFIANVEALHDSAPVQRVAETSSRAMLVAPQSGPAPAAAAAARPPSFLIGRAAVLARLRSAWQRASRGARMIAWVAGEPGIGKTTLIEHFASGLGNVTCARGQCVHQYGSGEPFHPVLEALAQLCRGNPDAAPLLRAVAPTWLLQLPWVSTAQEREALRHELVGATPERMLREMGEFLDRYTESRPLLLITEDLHWSDRPTIQLIDFLARRRSGGRVMWLSSFRLAEIVAGEHPLKTLRHELRLHGLCEEIVLDSFSEAEVAAYLAERLPAIAKDESAVRALHERTEGVPLFVASMASDIAARSSETGVATAELLATSAVPENLLAIIEHYSSELDNERRSLLAAAAVCGMEFRADTLSRVLKRDAVEVVETCERLLREQLWLAAPRAANHDDAHGERYSFRHALFRQVLYDRMGSSARADLHRRVAAVLERERAEGRTVSAAQLATHFDRGRSPLEALRYYAEAAEAALMQLGPAECMSLTERGLSLVPRAPADSRRTSLEIALATLRGTAAFHVLGTGDEARQAFVRGRSLLADVPLHPMRGLLLHGTGQLLNLRAEYAEALATADLADSLVAENSDPLLEMAACTARGQAYMLQGRPRAARESLERGLPAIESTSAASDQRLIADPRLTLLPLLSIQLATLGLVKQARDRMKQAYALVDQLAQPVALMVTIWCDALVEVRLGDAERVGVLADQMSSLVDRFALAQGRTACRWFRALADARRGDARDSFAQIRSAYEENTALGMIAGGSEVLGYAAEALVLQGALDDAQAQLEQAFEIVNTHGERIYLPQLLLTESAIARARGRRAAADASIRRALEEARAQEAPWLELLALTKLCESSSAKSADRRALGALISELAEGHDTPAHARARVALERGRPD